MSERSALSMRANKRMNIHKYGCCASAKVNNCWILLSIFFRLTQKLHEILSKDLRKCRFSIWWDPHLITKCWNNLKKGIFWMECDLMNLPNPLNQSKDWLFQAKEWKRVKKRKRANKTSWHIKHSCWLSHFKYICSVAPCIVYTWANLFYWKTDETVLLDRLAFDVMKWVA